MDSSGLVKALAKGTAVITATSANGLQARCAVTVLVPAVSIQLSQTSLTLKEGESKTITAQALPLESADIIKWRSDNAAVAEVYNGLIVAKKAGTAAISAYTDSGAQTTCTVMVQKPVSTNPGNSGGSSGNTGPSASPGGNSGTSAGSNTVNYTGQIRKTKAAKAKINSLQNVKAKSIKLKLSGMSGYDGYQIQYGLKKNFKGAKSITKKNNTVTIKKLKIKKTYYVRVRVYKKIAGKTYYGKWSSRKTIKIKK
ncbi:MAG: hypothetical protein HFJ04_03470 [Lachnospiraceae bacterium]|nr:hypothetical protein [Lachnospiraceae bacterium]